MVKPSAYLIQNDEICKVSITSTLSTSWSIHILMLNNVNMIFNYKTGGVSITHNSKTLQQDVYYLYNYSL